MNLVVARRKTVNALASTLATLAAGVTLAFLAWILLTFVSKGIAGIDVAFFTRLPSRVLLPTPEPPKMPILWPRPQVRKPSIARTPVVRRSRIGSRSSGPGGWASRA